MSNYVDDLFAFVVLGFVSSVLCREIGCEWDVKFV